VNKKKLSDTDTLYREIRKRSYVGVKKRKKEPLTTILWTMIDRQAVDPPILMDVVDVVRSNINFIYHFPLTPSCRDIFCHYE
jgi:hypothetical protein